MPDPRAWDPAEQYRDMARDLLDRHPLRRGPFLIPDEMLRRIIPEPEDSHDRD